MKVDDGDLKQAFDRFADGQYQRVEKAEPEVPDMIQEDQLVIQPVGPVGAQAVDAYFFDLRWNRQLQVSRVPDGFDQVEARHGETLSQNFNAQSTGGATREQGRGDGFDQVDRNAALSERFNEQARRRERERG